MPIYLFGPPVPHRLPCWLAAPDGASLPRPFYAPAPDPSSLPRPSFDCVLAAVAPAPAVVALIFDSWNVFRHCHGIVPSVRDFTELANLYVMPVLHVQPDHAQEERHEPPDFDPDWVVVEFATVEYFDEPLELDFICL